MEEGSSEDHNLRSQREAGVGPEACRRVGTGPAVGEVVVCGLLVDGSVL